MTAKNTLMSAGADDGDFGWVKVLASLTGLTPESAYTQYQRRVEKLLKTKPYWGLDPAEVCNKFEQKFTRLVRRGVVVVSLSKTRWGLIDRVLGYAVREVWRSHVRRLRRQAHYLDLNPDPEASPLQIAAFREELEPHRRHLRCLVFRKR